MTIHDSLCVIDWGSSRGRAWIIRSGTIVDSLEWDHGVLTADVGDKRKFLESRIAGALEVHEVETVLGVGMIGSRSGIAETPYLECPVNVAAWVEQSVEAGRVGQASLRLFPGVSSHRSPGGSPGIMRGEEFGVFSLIGNRDHSLFVLPGTHSKWVWTQGESIENFETYPTGEMFHQWRNTGSMSSLLAGFEQVTERGFQLGMGIARDVSNLPSALFSLRARVMLHELDPQDLLGALSGALIMSEVLAGRSNSPGHTKVLLVGSGEVSELYELALQAEGFSVQRAPSDPLSFADRWLKLDHVGSGN